MEREKLYTSIVLDDNSQSELINFAMKYMPFENNKMFCHHMTIAFYSKGVDIPRDLDEWAETNEGKTYNMTITHYGHNDKAFAVLVDTDVPCNNKHKHVTLATNADTNGKPSESNTITEWKEIPNRERITLNGVVTINYRK